MDTLDKNNGLLDNIPGDLCNRIGIYSSTTVLSVLYKTGLIAKQNLNELMYNRCIELLHRCNQHIEFTMNSYCDYYVIYWFLKYCITVNDLLIQRDNLKCIESSTRVASRVYDYPNRSLSNRSSTRSVSGTDITLPRLRPIDVPNNISRTRVRSTAIPNNISRSRSPMPKFAAIPHTKIESIDYSCTEGDIANTEEYEQQQFRRLRTPARSPINYETEIIQDSKWNGQLLKKIFKKPFKEEICRITDKCINAINFDNNLEYNISYFDELCYLDSKWRTWFFRIFSHIIMDDIEDDIINRIIKSVCNSKCLTDKIATDTADTTRRSFNDNFREEEYVSDEDKVGVREPECISTSILSFNSSGFDNIMSACIGEVKYFIKTVIQIRPLDNNIIKTFVDINADVALGIIILSSSFNYYLLNEYTKMYSNKYGLIDILVIQDVYEKLMYLRTPLPRETTEYVAKVLLNYVDIETINENAANLLYCIGSIDIINKILLSMPHILHLKILVSILSQPQYGRGIEEDYRKFKVHIIDLTANILINNGLVFDNDLSDQLFMIFISSIVETEIEDNYDELLQSIGELYTNRVFYQVINILIICSNKLFKYIVVHMDTQSQIQLLKKLLEIGNDDTIVKINILLDLKSTLCRHITSITTYDCPKLCHIVYSIKEVAIKIGIAFFGKYYMHLDVIKEALSCEYISINNVVLITILERLVASGNKECFEYILSSKQFKNCNISDMTVKEYYDKLYSVKL